MKYIETLQEEYRRFFLYRNVSDHHQSRFCDVRPRDRPSPDALEANAKMETWILVRYALPGTIARRRSDSADARLQRLELRVCDIMAYIIRRLRMRKAFFTEASGRIASRRTRHPRFRFCLMKFRSLIGRSNALSFKRGQLFQGIFSFDHKTQEINEEGKHPLMVIKIVKAL